MSITTLRVRKLYEGDIILTSTFGKLRPLLILKVTENFTYGVPLSTNKEELGFTTDGLNACRFLDPKLTQYVHPIIHRIGGKWAKKHWLGRINPASLIKVKNYVKETLNKEIFQ